MSKEAYIIIGKRTESYDPDPGNIMSRCINTSKPDIKVYDKESFIAAYFNLSDKQKASVKCIKGEYFTPEIKVTMEMK